MGLGALHTISLAQAREAAREARQLLREGIDPIEDRRAKEAARRLNAVETTTFRQAARSYMDAHEKGWRNAKHAAQWRSTLATYAYPTIGDLSVQAIDTGLVLKVLEPIWNEKPETAGRLRGRIEAVLDGAKARGHREGENPARWRGHLDKLLPARAKVRKVVHHPALPYDDLGAFMKGLRTQNGTAARGLEFLILTAARTGEVIGAKWDEVDLGRHVWTVPADRMKAYKQHRVPLSPAAVAVLEAMEDSKQSNFIFPGTRPGQPLSNLAFLKLLERMERGKLTVHGFRSTFRDWAAERTAYPRELAEMALAHAIADKVERAYRRGDLFERRARLMEDWAAHCAREGGPADVVPIREGNTERKRDAF
jgi:integrase